MAVYKQTTKLKNIFKGTTKFKNAYKGTAKLWGSTNRKVFFIGLSRQNLYTVDGINFEQTSAPIPRGGAIISMATNGDIIIATHSDKVPTKSTDGGRTWSDLSIAFDGRNAIIAYGQGMWVMTVGLFVYYSSDLQTWNSTKLTRVDSGISDIIFINNYFYIYARMTGDPGRTSNSFVKLPSLPFNNSDLIFTRVEYEVYVTSFGDSYQYYPNGNMLLVKGTDKLFRSLDMGTTWSEFSYPQSFRPAGFVYGNGKYCAIYYDQANSQIKVYYSTNLASWTNVIVYYYTNIIIKGLEFINGRFIMVMKDTQVAVSENCINWTNITVPQFTSGDAKTLTTDRVYE